MAGIDGKTFETMVISAANALENQKEDINNLNVFPVPDGDTGSNMSMTIGVVRDKAGSLPDKLSECAAQGVHGKDTTPFLLARVAELTGGDSLESNIRLVYNNAALAAESAKALSKL